VPAQLQPIAKPDATHAETPVVLPDGTAYLASSTSGQLLRSSVHQPDRCTAASAAAAAAPAARRCRCRRAPPLAAAAKPCWRLGCASWPGGQLLAPVLFVQAGAYRLACGAATGHGDAP
jgi:hypothetical protein